MTYKFKKPPEKEYGEFECPYCKKVFFNKTSLSGHIGGAHRRGAAKLLKRPRCKFCDIELIKDKNWPKWAVEQQNLICQKCKRRQNRLSYYKIRKHKKERLTLFEERLKKIREKKGITFNKKIKGI